jgi:hypothetical protein
VVPGIRIEDLDVLAVGSVPAKELVRLPYRDLG